MDIHSYTPSSGEFSYSALYLTKNNDSILTTSGYNSEYLQMMSIDTSSNIIDTNKSGYKYKSHGNVIGMHCSISSGNKLLIFANFNDINDRVTLYIFKADFSFVKSIPNYFSIFPTNENVIVTNSIYIEHDNIIATYAVGFNSTDTLNRFQIVIVNSTSYSILNAFEFKNPISNNLSYPLQLKNNYLESINDSKILFICTSSLNNKSIYFWFIDYTNNIYTDSMPGYTFNSFNIIVSFVYVYDKINNYIILVYNDYNGTDYNLNIAYFTYHSMTFTLIKPASTLVYNIAGPQTINVIKIFYPFLFVSLDTFTQTFLINYNDINNNTFTQWMSSLIPIKMHDILAYYPNNNNNNSTEVVLYFNYNDNNTYKISKIDSPLNCFFYLDSTSTKCLQTCILPLQHVYQTKCYTCDDITKQYFYEGICYSVCPVIAKYFCATTKQCYTTCPVTARYSNLNNECVASCSIPFVYNNNNVCVSECNANGNNYINTNNNYCISNCSAITDTYLVSNTNQCVSNCTSQTINPNFKYLDTCLNQCIDSTCSISSCKLKVQSIFKCVSNCSSSESVQYPYYTSAVNTCTNTCIFPYIFIDKYNCYSTCPDDKPYKDPFSNSCVTNCSENNKNNSNNTYTLSNLNTKICVTKCPLTFPYNNSNTCSKTCPVYINTQNNNCVDTCPDTVPYLNNNLYCVSNCTLTTNNKFIDSTNNNCVNSCPANIPYIINSSICVSTCSLYFSISFYDSDTFMCYSTCPNTKPYVFKNIDSNNNNNNKCVAVCPENMKYNFNNICVSDCPINNSYIDSTSLQCLNKCKTNNQVFYKYYNDYFICDDYCPSNLPYLNINSNTNNNNYECVESCSKESKLYVTKYQCVKQCPQNSIFVSFINVCVNSCKEINLYYNPLNNTCNTKCPKNYGMDDSNYTCINCSTITKVLYNNTCLHNCPENYLADINNICVFSDVSSVDSNNNNIISNSNSYLNLSLLLPGCIDDSNNDNYINGMKPKLMTNSITNCLISNYSKIFYNFTFLYIYIYVYRHFA